ncbi:DUF2474 domain-containing protein [Cupriavidus taiwanensis]|uniref:DUF2474 domain-containing protein n=1 Tax=Cupriavidus taiwanensis TaxID=164546 RepID=UPI00253FCD60|nr:DUF2474 domain-containing protein [Cupriavidus taiwanensis]MDK3023776.1 DUF2474 domain-containing protein [Cupriavidus taiwanensis]
MNAPRTHSGTRTGTWLRRIGWLVLIWAASVAALGVAAWVLRLVMRSVGFHS